MYDAFLQKTASTEVREMLRETSDDRQKYSPEFRMFKNQGHHFTSELSRLLGATYDATHPIHTALRFSERPTRSRIGPAPKR
jgi:hypothetical protein